MVTIASNFKDNNKRCKEIICNILQTIERHQLTSFKQDNHLHVNLELW